MKAYLVDDHVLTHNKVEIGLTIECTLPEPTFTVQGVCQLSGRTDKQYMQKQFTFYVVTADRQQPARPFTECGAVQCPFLFNCVMQPYRQLPSTEQWWNDTDRGY
jgi:hypothetical protein